MKKTTTSVWEVRFLKLRFDCKPAVKPMDYLDPMLHRLAYERVLTPIHKLKGALHPELMEKTQSSTLSLEPCLHSIIPPDPEITSSIHLP